MSTLAERLDAAIKHRNCKPADVARACGIAPASMSDLLSGKSKSMKAETALRATDFLCVRPHWLILDLGPMLFDKPNHYAVHEDVAAPPAGLPASISQDAMEIAKVWDKIPRQVRDTLRATVQFSVSRKRPLRSKSRPADSV